VSDKRVQAVLTYAELNELLGQTERGPIEAIAADPVQRRVKIIFGASGCPDGIEPWVFKIERSQSPPSTHTSDGSPTSVDGGEQTDGHDQTDRMKCVWDQAWAGPCGVESDQRLCSTHRGQTCIDCDKEAIAECESAGQFVCGYPLCEEHMGMCSRHRGR
jgi:hypothetical protein